MNNNMLKRIPLALLAGILAVSCAQKTSLTTGEKAQEYLEKFIEKYYPHVTPDESGIYILEDTPGTGKPWSEDSLYTYASITIRTLGGTVSSTQEEKTAQQLGTYVKGNYYGPRFLQTGENMSYAGLDGILRGMRMGGTRKALVPACLLTTSRYGTFKEYLNNSTQDSALEYTVTLGGQVSDIEQMEKDSLARYVLRTFGEGIKPSPVKVGEEADGRFYFLTDSSGFAGTKKFPADTTIKINYTGRLLNGQVFDTTLEKAAKDAGIYNSARSYTAANLTIGSNYTEIKMNDSSLIEGFSAGVSQMHWLGQKGIILFVSTLGYASTGSGQTIPPYSPLLFEVELL